MSEHTKVPWDIDGPDGILEDAIMDIWSGVYHICSGCTPPIARFIVLSANNHEALVEALTEAETVLARLDTLSVPFPVLIKVRAILAKISQEAGE